MGEKVKSLMVWLRRYMPLPTVCVLAALVYLIFFSETTVKTAVQYRHTIDSLRTEVEIQRDSMLYYQALNRRLSHDPELMEQVVREQYNMNRLNEDVYVFEEPKEK